MINVEEPHLAIYQPLCRCQLEEISLKTVDALLHDDHADKAGEAEKYQQDNAETNRAEQFEEAGRYRFP